MSEAGADGQLPAAAVAVPMQECDGAMLPFLLPVFYISVQNPRGNKATV